MPQTAATVYPGDQPKEAVDQDLSLIGVREFSPGLIPPGLAASCRNGRWSTGSAEPRLGVAKLPWSNRVSTVSTDTQPFTRVYGAAEFQEGLGVKWLIIAADGKVYRCRQFTAAAELPLPPGVVIDHDVSFTPTRNGLVMWRGAAGLRPLLMPSLELGFQTITQAAQIIGPGAGTENLIDGIYDLEAASFGDWIGNRLFFPYATSTELDLLGISDYGNATRHAGPRAQTRINQGSSDRLLRAVAYSESVAICLKEGSIYALSNVKGDLSTMGLTILAENYGLCSPKAVSVCGKDLWFLSTQRGVCSIRQSEQGKLQGTDLPKSFTFQQTIARINWEVAKTKATSTYFNNKFYLAVPLDDAVHAGVDQIAGMSYDGSGELTINVPIGTEYRWVKGANDTDIDNDGEIISESQDFTSTDLTLTLSGTAGQPVSGTLRPIRRNVNNAVLVFDFITNEWAGVDDGCAWCVKDWVIATYQGVDRQMFIAEDGFINCIEELYYDECGNWTLSDTNELFILHSGTATFLDVSVLPGQSYRWQPSGDWASLTNGTNVYTSVTDFVAESNTVRVTNTAGGSGLLSGTLQAHVFEIRVEYVDHDWVSRGYGGETVGRKKWTDMEFHAQSWYPEFQISALTEGFREEEQILPPDTGWQVRDARIYDEPWDAPDWNPSNSNNDHGTPGRQDYAVVLGETTIPPSTPGSILPGLKYMVESVDVTTACVISYNGNNYTNQQTFVGVQGVTEWYDGLGQPVVYPPGSYLEFGVDGTMVDQHQEWVEPLRIPSNSRGRLVQLRFHCRRGRLIVKGVAPRGTFTSNAKGHRT